MNKNLKRPRQPFPSLPSGIDKKVKSYFDSFRDKNESPPELEDMDLEIFNGQEFVDYARSWRTEPKWRDPETSAVLRGGLDDLLENRDGELVVLDYKTRGSEPKEESGVPEYYHRQVNLYNLILEENGYETADHGAILYFYPDRFTEHKGFDFHTELRKIKIDTISAKKLVRDAVEVAKGPAPEHDSSCEYCQWSLNYSQII